ncbi:MAG: hypothetical protein IJM83_07300 [Firmicutes bacterium]|nr:hypothetical protein [Bacillota bacterium]
MQKAKKSNAIWYIICFAIGVIAYVIALLFWKDYFQADVHYKAETRIVKVESSLHYRLKENKDEDEISDYEEYYEYTLHWAFTDPKTGKERSYYTETEASYDNAYHEGSTQNIYVYYNQGDDDFEILSLTETIIFVAAGSLFIVMAFVDLISIANRKKKAAKAAAAAVKAQPYRQYPQYQQYQQYQQAPQQQRYPQYQQPQSQQWPPQGQ